jgi:hypothetical protein
VARELVQAPGEGAQDLFSRQRIVIIYPGSRVYQPADGIHVVPLAKVCDGREPVFVK